MPGQNYQPAREILEPVNRELATREPVQEWHKFRRMTQEEMLAILLTVRSRFGADTAKRLTLVPSPTGCEMFFDGVFVVSVDFELNGSGIQLALEPVRKFKVIYKKVKKTFYTLWDAVAWVVGKQTIDTVRKGEPLHENEQPETSIPPQKTPIRGLETGSFFPVEKARTPGWIEGSLAGKTQGECETMYDIGSFGVNVEIIEESKIERECTSDMWVSRGKWRLKVELKNLTTKNRNTIKLHINHAVKQGCELLLLDMRKSSITFEEMVDAIMNCIGRNNTKTLSIDLEVWLSEKGKELRYFRKRDE